MRAWALALGVLAAGGAARADGLPWIAPGDVPLPSGVRSAHILYKDEPLFTSPDARSARRGAAALGASLPIYAAVRGPGCPGRWLSVGPMAWVCETRVALGLDAPLAVTMDHRAGADGLPYRYYFVGPDGSLGYSQLETAEEGAPDAELQPGFALALTRVTDKVPGDAFGLTTHGLWVPMRDLGAARPETFAGTAIEDGKLDRLAWVFTKSAPVYSKPEGARLGKEEHLKFEQLTVLETRTLHGHRWFRIGEGRWVSDKNARAPTPGDEPAGLRAGERWIDVDIDQQVLVAYEGSRPVFATLVSTGKGTGKSERATPLGEHRIWVKLASADMDNLEDEDANRYYAIEAVPWVMFFTKGYGLHGTFWHHSFGEKRSHGCVNLTPLDAERLFYWAGPRLPAGWSAALPTPYDPGTLVRIR